MSKPIDYSLQLLLQQINATQHTHAPACLWFVDEHIHLEHLNSLAQLKALDIISNRFEIVAHAKQLKCTALFNDFELGADKIQFYQYVFLRLPKEKILYQHLLALAFNALQNGGTLFLSGAKHEGFKSAYQCATSIFENHGQKIAKLKTATIVAIKKNANRTAAEHGAVNYNQAYFSEIQLHDIQRASLKLELHSKPGQYGWQKIDGASQLLADQFATIYASFITQPQSFLDLGCGYGYLTLRSKNLNITQRTATDNNAAALSSCKKNCHLNNINCEVIASDAGQQLHQKYDWIVCNPPFHSGFFNNPLLLDKFLHNTKRLLSIRGRASFVSNEFIPLQREAQKLFSQVHLIQHEKGFNIHMLIP